ncbi:MAG: LysM peptidoglycan-binding domain-containing protein [Candidatus Caldatribacteriaceae bacterium]
MKGRLWKSIGLVVLIWIFLAMEVTVAWGMTYHVVQPGESLWIISRRYRVSLQDLLRINGLSEKSVLYPGMKIIVKEGEVGYPAASCEYYQVQKGDTLWSIARKFNTSVRSLMEVNGLNENSILQIGQKILISTTINTPVSQEEISSTTITHIVKQGESLWVIARLYGVSMKSIMEANSLNEHSILQVGMKLAIPGIAVSKVSSKGATSSAPKENYQTYRIQPGDTLWSISRRFRISVDTLAKVNGLNESSILKVGRELRIPTSVPQQYVKVDTQGNFLWPVRGRISSPFGTRGRSFHNGVDIIAPAGTLIRAAQSGVVSFSGTMRGYGRVVIIDHPGGWQTVYAHNSANMVTKGQRVNQGDPIGKVGRSGNATANHLHFEVRRNGRCMDPLQFLRK